MRLRHLEIFHAVMRSGSVSGAADLLNLSQSAASKALAQAEHSLGLTLFKRVQGRLVRTREAEQLFAQTTLLFAQAENVQRLARNLKRNPEDHLRIGCLPSLGLSLLPGAVDAFRRRCPGVSVEILTNNGDALAEQVFAREVDLGICFDMPLKQGLDRIGLGQVRGVHLGPPSCPPQSGAVRLAELDMNAWIGIGGSDPLAQRIRDVCEQLQVPMPPPAIETRTYYVAAALARQGLGFALVDELTARAVAQDLPARPLEPVVAVDAVAIHASSSVRSQAFDAFVATLRKRFGAAS
ncbi:LysR family transcriptional regulator [Xylophilus sp.]|uniref:LysR family transcriptional regulator n=1 Tax=Xylophilus sp. TaxID=2653893 RepID=UPI0013BA5EBF|nr:LysR family transcriptional regulator [Xylophilus sp.]KAF1050103.1 MAG: Octopine catabolism/uptake operon regulatory protein OccR [Xylophilus sp.]